MKLLSKSKKFFAFNSETEFLNTVYRLDQEATVSMEFLIDEKEDLPDLYCSYGLLHCYCFTVPLFI